MNNNIQNIRSYYRRKIITDIDCTKCINYSVLRQKCKITGKKYLTECNMYDELLDAKKINTISYE